MAPPKAARGSDARVGQVRGPEPYAAAFLIAVAFNLALGATSGLTWPPESDFYRDMGAAQSVLDGLAGADPAYLGEVGWYNPLVPTLVAFLTKVTELPLHTVYARAGPFLNLLGPLFFYVMAASLVGRGAGLLALGGYLFLGNPDEPSWFHATYSPWLWPMNFAQGLFYATVATYWKTLRSGSWIWDLLTGLLLGLTFLSHTAPALVFVLTLLLLTAVPGEADSSVWRRVGRLTVIGLVSLAMSLPYLVPLFLAYRFKVVNVVPAGFAAMWGTDVLWNLLSLRTVVAAGGAWLLLFRAPEAAAASRGGSGKVGGAILWALLASTSCLLIYGMGAQSLAARFGLRLPSLVPAFHFHLYAKSVECLFFGIGSAALLHRIVRFLGERWPARKRAAREPWWREHRGVAVTAALVLSAVGAVRYARAVDLVKFRLDAERYAREEDRVALYRWVLEYTHPTDVFLADRDLSLSAVVAAGRKVVCLDAAYSNPYVSYEERARDRDRLFKSARERDARAFAALAGKYRLSHVVVAPAKGDSCCQVEGELTWPGYLELAFQSGTIRVYRVRTALADPAGALENLERGLAS